MQEVTEKTLTLRFTPESWYYLENQAKKMNVNIASVISEALALFKLVQGKTVVLKDERQETAIEIKKFAQP